MQLQNRGRAAAAPIDLETTSSQSWPGKLHEDGRHCAVAIVQGKVRGGKAILGPGRRVGATQQQGLHNLRGTGALVVMRRPVECGHAMLGDRAHIR
eukprot:scaffold24040_cov67-Phaeocystis_antarctica.AAC.6